MSKSPNQRDEVSIIFIFEQHLGANMCKLIEHLEIPIGRASVFQLFQLFFIPTIGLAMKARL